MSTGAWQPGDDPGRRRFVSLPEPLALEAGGTLDSVTVAYETWGTLAPDASNAVLVLHALTGDSHATGPAEPGHLHAGWWDGMIGARRADRHRPLLRGVPERARRLPGHDRTVVGRGRRARRAIRRTSLASRSATRSPSRSRWPMHSASRAGALAGGSMGGMRVLEWAVGYPERVARAAVISAGAYATAEQIGLCRMQIRAIQADPAWVGGDYYDKQEATGPQAGLSIARGIGQISYRSELELDTRFGREAQDGEPPLEGGRYAVESYLDHHGARLARRFDANSYIVLSEAMNHHDVGRGRGGVGHALAGVTAAVTIAGMSSDRLYPLRLQHELAELVPTASPVDVIDTIHGHDGFLIEADAVGRVLRRALA